MSQASAKKWDKNSTERIRVVDSSDLDLRQRDIVQTLVRASVGPARILGALFGVHPWDVRPIIERKGEVDACVVRFLDPQVCSDAQAAKQFLNRLHVVSSLQHISSGYLDQGVVDGQIWFRRLFCNFTLQDTINSEEHFDIEECFGIILKLFSELASWQAEDIVHGHIIPENIFIDEFGSLFLVDAVVGEAVFDVTNRRGGNLYSRGYDPDTFAPELLTGMVSPQSDLYGAGLVIAELLKRVSLENSVAYDRKQFQTLERVNGAIEILGNLSHKLQSQDQGDRGNVVDILDQLRGFWGSIESVVSVKDSEEKPNLDRAQGPQAHHSPDADPLSSRDVDRDSIIGHLVRGRVFRIGSRGLAEIPEANPEANAQSTHQPEDLDPASNGQVLAPAYPDEVQDERGLSSLSDGIYTEEASDSSPESVRANLIQDLLGPKDDFPLPVSPIEHVQKLSESTLDETSHPISGGVQVAQEENRVKNLRPPSKKDVQFEIKRPTQVLDRDEYEATVARVLRDEQESLLLKTSESPESHLGRMIEPVPFSVERKPSSSGKGGVTITIGSAHKDELESEPENLGKESHQEVVPRPRKASSQHLEEIAYIDNLFSKSATKSGAHAEGNTSKDLRLASDHKNKTQKAKPSESIREDKGKPVATSNNRFWILSIFLCSVLVMAGLIYRNSLVLESFLPGSSPVYSKDELATFWKSQQPSNVSKVIRTAIDPGNPESKAAETIIVTSARSGVMNPGDVNGMLIRYGFDDRWEIDLSDTDRQAIIAIASAKLVRGLEGFSPVPPSALHPGVLLAISATAPADAQHAMGILKSLPASSFTSLPPPIGDAFQSLLEENPQFTCADTAIREMAQIVFQGTSEKGGVIFSFLRTNFPTRVKALYTAFREDKEALGKLVSVILLHPNYRSDSPNWLWAKEWNLANNKSLSAIGKLEVLAGQPPLNEEIAVEDSVRLFDHPSPALRSFAIERVLSAIHFRHPGAFDLFSRLVSEPQLLGPRQTYLLASLLQSGPKAQATDIVEWLATEPPRPVMESLLLATAGEKEYTSLDFHISRYLQADGWKPDEKTLEVLSKHPEPLTRFFAYSEIFNLNNREHAKALLTRALEQETRDNFRKRLSEMISSLAEKKIKK